MPISLPLQFLRTIYNVLILVCKTLRVFFITCYSAKCLQELEFFTLFLFSRSCMKLTTTRWDCQGRRKWTRGSIFVKMRLVKMAMGNQCAASPWLMRIEWVSKWSTMARQSLVSKYQTSVETWTTLSWDLTTWTVCWITLTPYCLHILIIMNTVVSGSNFR